MRGNPSGSFVRRRLKLAAYVENDAARHLDCSCEPAIDYLSSMDDQRAAAVTFGGVTPILRVSDFDASVDHYVNVLGFKVDWGGGGFCSVSRDRASIMLCQGSQGHPGTWLWFAVSDADAVYEELQARGARIRHPPQNFDWGSRELHVFDPDGHVLRLASEAPEDGPLGIWLNEDGSRWQTTADGRWIRLE